MEGAYIKWYNRALLNAFDFQQKAQGYVVPLREPANEAETSEMLEAERAREQTVIDEGMLD